MLQVITTSYYDHLKWLDQNAGWYFEWFYEKYDGNGECEKAYGENEENGEDDDSGKEKEGGGLKDGKGPGNEKSEAFKAKEKNQADEGYKSTYSNKETTKHHEEDDRAQFRGCDRKRKPARPRLGRGNGNIILLMVGGGAHAKTQKEFSGIIFFF